jgi:hypothetical protein
MMAQVSSAVAAFLTRALRACVRFKLKIGKVFSLEASASINGDGK